ncbi:MAG: hypothetical protein K1X75_12785 [Leptospirales bacterium]|nr:hypothetical protein [Leptospirales bacterium]
MILALYATGLLQIGLAFLHLYFARRFQWRQEAARLSRLNEQIFHVHTFFVCLTLILFGIWTLAQAADLAAGKQRWLAGGISVFWFCRLAAQFFVYDSALWRGKRLETAVHVLFGLLWSYLTAVYAWLAMQA